MDYKGLAKRLGKIGLNDHACPVWFDESADALGHESSDKGVGFHLAVSIEEQDRNSLFDVMVKDILSAHPSIGTLERIDNLPKMLFLNRIVQIKGMPDVKVIRFVKLRLFIAPINKILPELTDRNLSLSGVNRKHEQWQSKNEQPCLHFSLPSLVDKGLWLSPNYSYKLRVSTPSILSEFPIEKCLQFENLFKLKRPRSGPWISDELLQNNSFAKPSSLFSLFGHQLFEFVQIKFL